MKLIKCPRCDLNYIQENEKLCKVCQRELKGSQVEDEMELVLRVQRGARASRSRCVPELPQGDGQRRFRYR